MNEKLNRKRTSVQKIIITSDMAGQRIDNFLLKMFKDIPKSKIYRIIRKGEVRINGGRIKVKYKLRCKDELRVPPLNIEPDQKKIKIKNSQSFEKKILFEDSELIVVNKPSGIAVHGGSGINYGLIEIIRAIRPDFDDLSSVASSSIGANSIANSAISRISGMSQMSRLSKNSDNSSTSNAI